MWYNFLKRQDESVFERFYLIQLASVPKNLPETSSRYIDTFTHYYNDPKKYGNPTMTDVRLWYLHFLSVLFLYWQKQISYNRVQWHSFLQASTVLFIEQYAINGWQKKKRRGKDGSGLCLCLYWSCDIFGETDGRTDGWND